MPDSMLDISNGNIESGSGSVTSDRNTMDAIRYINEPGSVASEGNMPDSMLDISSGNIASGSGSVTSDRNTMDAIRYINEPGSVASEGNILASVLDIGNIASGSGSVTNDRNTMDAIRYIIKPGSVACEGNIPDSMLDTNNNESGSVSSDGNIMGAIILDVENGNSEPRELVQEMQVEVAENNAASNANPKRGRKRTRDIENWKRNVRIKQRLSGQPYVSRRNKMVPIRKPKNCACSCRYHCTQKFSEEDRSFVCSEFYKLGTWMRQNDFLCSSVSVTGVSRRKMPPNGEAINIRRTNSCTYTLVHNNTVHRVCKSFYCKTLCISSKRVRRALQEKTSTNSFGGQDYRIGKKPSNKTTDEQEQGVNSHINSFPKMDPHYCRRDSTKQYLSPDLNIRKMFHLYKTDFCVRQNIVNPVSYTKYRNIFTSQYNLKCFVPKKDQCTQCNAYNNGNAEYKENIKPTWEAHKQREKESLDGKAMDKSKSHDDQSFKAITFDLQAVLYTPFSGDCQIFYKRKLAVYNFTIYESDTNNGICYVWDETDGKRGSIEISTALLLYLRSLPQTITHVASFCDTCSGQNRNKYMCASLLYATQTIPQLQIFDLKYMESGHSYLEADSIHATIENARRHQSIYTTQEWQMLIRTARKKPRPYIVKSVNHHDFMDFKKLSTLFMKNTSKTVTGETVQWLKIKWLRFEKNDPLTIKFKYRLNEETFQVIKVSDNTTCNVALLPLELAYTSRMPISKAKKNDLLQLLQTRVIPVQYTEFYALLPSSDDQVDRLAEPDAEEVEDDGEEGHHLDELPSTRRVNQNLTPVNNEITSRRTPSARRGVLSQMQNLPSTSTPCLKTGNRGSTKGSGNKKRMTTKNNISVSISLLLRLQYTTLLDNH
jgi:hypothetical protein